MITMFVLASAMILASPADQPDKEEKAVRSAMDQFAQAVLKSDKATLDKLMADTVVYSHSSGKAETKQEAITAFMSGNPKYEVFEYKAQKIQFYGKTAVVRGDVAIRNVQNGTPNSLVLNILQIWVHNPQGWQMVARQSTRLP